MRLPEICIRQPVLAIVLSLTLAVLGLIGYQRLEILFFPKLQLPVVNISTYYQGASPQLMESQVTTPIENAVAGIDNIDYMTSSSSTSWSSIRIQFKLGGDLESEAAQVRDKVSGIKSKLPADANPPSVSLSESAGQIIGLSFIDPNMKLQDMRDYLARSVVPYFRQLPGVAGVGLYGSTDYAMRVWLNPAKMASLGITIANIKTAITVNNIYFPAGAFRGPTRNYSIISDTRLKDATQFANIIVKTTPQGVIRLKDVADVRLGKSGFDDLPMLIGGKPGLTVQIAPLQSANPIQVAQAVKKTFAQLKSKLPKGLQSAVLFNNATFLQQSIHETFWAIGEAVVLVIIVVILFLGSLRAAFIPIVTIPISLISVFFVIKLLGFSINIMSLLAMVLAIGLVVDDAIVMLENIHRHIEEGLPPFQAALVGSREIAFPIVVMALTLIAVYAPVGFVQGYTSELFKEFAFTLAAAVVISGFVALTLSPMMCSRLLQKKESEGGFIHLVDAVFERISTVYQSLLKNVLLNRLWVIFILLLVALGGYGIFNSMNSEFLPKEDYSMISVSISPPAGSSLDYTEKYVKQVVAILNKVPEIKKTVFQMGAGGVGVSCYLKPWNQRTRSSSEIVKALNPVLNQVPGVTAVASVPDMVSYGVGGSDLEINFMTTGQYRDLLEPINKLMSILKKYPGVSSVDTNMRFDSQQYSIEINRDLTALSGVNIQDIADTVQAMMSGIHWTDIQSGSKSYEVLLQMNKQDLMNFDSLKKIYVPATPVTATPVPATAAAPVAQTMVPLSSLVKLTPQVGQGSLSHFNRMRAGDVVATIAPGYTESEVIKFVQQQLPKVVNKNIRYAFSGKSAEYLESAGSMVSILILSFVFIYLVLAAQFGSFIDPLIILLAVPLSMVGALFSLWIAGGTFSLIKLHDANPEDQALLGHLMLVANQLATKLEVDQGYRIIINNGAKAGQSVFHLHVHLLGGRIMNWPPG